ncbi:Derlin-2/3 [Paragonimus westermani]|uniref:Derlin n=1 Tax=Paragonimus westermani TaxID=34504 RepID=A0A5J4NEF8_9TREM|nr:Derlin-2/3 [Paragonimus westermani]
MEIVRREIANTPPVTTVYIATCIFLTFAVQMNILSPFQLYYNPSLILTKFQVWRLVTSFCFFGTFNFNFLFNILFAYRYCRMLEETWYSSKTADFIMLFLFCGLLTSASLWDIYITSWKMCFLSRLTGFESFVHQNLCECCVCSDRFLGKICSTGDEITVITILFLRHNYLEVLPGEQQINKLIIFSFLKLKRKVHLQQLLTFYVTLCHCTHSLPQCTSDSCNLRFAENTADL